MRILTISTLCMLMVMNCHAGDPKTFDIKKLKESIHLINDGDVVKLKFGYRDRIERTADRAVSKLRQDGDIDYMDVYVIGVEGVEWLAKIPEGESNKSFYVFAKRNQANKTWELIGKEKVNNSTGSEFKW